MSHAPAAPCMQPGVYIDRHRHTAVLYKAGRVNVHYVTMADGVIEHRTQHAADFVKQFDQCWPHYPLRRAARLYLASQLSKTELAMRTLRALVQS